LARRSTNALAPKSSPAAGSALSGLSAVKRSARVAVPGGSAHSDSSPALPRVASIQSASRATSPGYAASARSTLTREMSPRVSTVPTGTARTNPTRR